MRPVDKGESPYNTIKKYQDALPYLGEKIGYYCSYCEFPIKHVPEVEHVVSKSKGGDITDWMNLHVWDVNIVMLENQLTQFLKMMMIFYG